MRKPIALACLLLLLLAAIQGGLQAATRAPLARPGSFTRCDVRTVNDLIEQVTTSPIVAQRYASHFGVSASHVAEYFRTNVRLVRLNMPIYTRSFYRTRTGRTQSKPVRFNRGDTVFMTSSGVPLLEVGCGNPLTKQLPTIPEVKVKPAVEEFAAPMEVVPDAVVAPAEPVGEVVALAPVAEPVVAPVTGMPFAPVMSVLAAIPALFGALSVQHSAPPPIVPEPSPQIVLAMGTCLLAAAGVWRRHKH